MCEIFYTSKRKKKEERERERESVDNILHLVFFCVSLFFLFLVDCRLQLCTLVCLSLEKKHINIVLRCACTISQEEK